MTFPETRQCRFVVLVSGQGSNLMAIYEAIKRGQIHAQITAVVSNRPHAPALDWAQQVGLATEVIDHRAFESRQEFDTQLAQTIEAYQPDYVLLAGFMRILTPEFVNRFLGRLINIHPSLLPDLPGLQTHQRAIDAGLTQHGCTVHFVTPELDHGPTIAQGALEVGADATASSLAQRVQKLEHIVYPAVAAWLAAGLVSLSVDQQVDVRGVAHRIFLEVS